MNELPDTGMAGAPIDHERLMVRAIEEARAAEAEGGVPIGAVLVDRRGVEIGAGHNRRMQNDDPTAHAELEALRAAGLAADLSGSVMATTMTPCLMCAGAIAYLGITTLVVGDSASFDVEGAGWLRVRGVDVIASDDDRCIELFSAWVATHANEWRQITGA